MIRRLNRYLSNIFFRPFRAIIRSEFDQLAGDVTYHMQLIASQSTANAILRCGWPLSKLSFTRKELLLHCLSHSDNHAQFFEFGVFKGDSLRIISNYTIQSVYGFDSFEGIPSEFHFAPKGTFSTSGEIPKLPENVTIIKGWFEDSLPEFLNENPSLKAGFVHIDCDLYTSTVTVLNHLESRFFDGTVILFDEYFNYPNWQRGEYKAFTEWLRTSAYSAEFLGASIRCIDPCRTEGHQAAFILRCRNAGDKELQSSRLTPGLLEK